MKFQTQKGFQAFKKEEERKAAIRESRGRKTWRFLMKEDEADAPIRFLTEEPICFYEHTIKNEQGGFDNHSCTADTEEGCEHCNNGHKPQWVGAWLVVDGREYQIKVKKDGKETGEVKVLKDQVRLLVRGSRDTLKLMQKSEKFGLTSRQWFVTRTGTGNTTSWDFERADEAERLTAKELDIIRQSLPPEIREMSFEDIVILNIDPTAKWPEKIGESKESASAKANAGVKPVSAKAEEPPKKTKLSFLKK